jgi:hypothetical protein
MTIEHEWKDPYKTAVLGTDWSKMEERIRAPESPISARLREFSLNHGGTPEENQPIADAVNGLKARGERRGRVERTETRRLGSKQRTDGDEYIGTTRA